MGRQSRKKRAAVPQPKGQGLLAATSSTDSNKVLPFSSRKMKRTGFRKAVLLAVLLAILVAVAYVRVLTCEFVNFDDVLDVVDNNHVNQGISWEGIVWAFTRTRSSNWMPLTWLSHALDCQLFGLAPWGHHFTNLLLHLLNTILFFFLLRRLTGGEWPGFVGAGLFGLHPIHVESVAWVAERKDVLSTTFFLLTLLAYTAYVWRLAERREVGRNPKSEILGSASVFYILSVAFFALGLMAKPMLVTLPFLLLLLDYWPFKRFQLKTRTSILKTCLRSFLEKVPFMVLTVASCVITFFAQRGAGAVVGIENYTLQVRLANAAVSYITYLRKLLVPYGLPVFEPHQQYSFGSPQAVVALIALMLLTGIVVANFRRRPYLGLGWFWYLGTLVPVIGLVQVGAQGLAYRYTYIPMMGVYIILAQLLREAPIAESCDFRTSGRAAPWFRGAVVSVSAALLCALGVLTWCHTRHWQNSETLYRYTLGVTERNWIVQGNLGAYYNNHQRYADAIPHLQKAIAILPTYPDARVNLAYAYKNVGKFREAIEILGPDLGIEDSQRANRFLIVGTAYGELQQYEKAAETLRQGLQRSPDAPSLLENLACIEYTNLKEITNAYEHFERLLRLIPNHPKREEYTRVINYLAPQLRKSGAGEGGRGIRSEEKN